MMLHLNVRDDNDDI